jgi:hypothetical protein
MGKDPVLWSSILDGRLEAAHSVMRIEIMSDVSLFSIAKKVGTFDFSGAIRPANSDGAPGIPRQPHN